MPSLAETQAMVRAAVVADTPQRLVAMLQGGPRPAARLAIHRRHYEASLVAALLQKFPAAAWYVGPGFIAEAARLYVQHCPPRALCIAEYGASFPAFVAELPGAPSGLEAMALFDWHLGHVAIAIEEPALGRDALSQYAPEALLDIAFATQSGVRYLSAPLPIDTFMRVYLEDSDQTVAADAEPVHLEIRGARGAFSFRRLDPAAYAFRSALWRGAPLGAACSDALALEGDFDAGGALAAFLTDGLATAILTKDDAL